MTTTPLSLSLRPSPSNEAASAEQLSLSDVLARITAEYGPTFASVTEDKLQSQIDKQQADDVEMEDVTDQDETKKPISREELVKIIQIASEESSLAQDFIGLLLSAVRPAAGGASMSPALKSAVPLGALGGARIFPQTQKPDLAVSIGWKKSAIESASQNLIAAADRLAQDSGETSRFVEGVLKIRAAGWAIVQIPAGSAEAQHGVLKVFYGFQKAGSDYHDPGIGYLKESMSGDLIFARDPRFADKKERMLRIRVQTKEGTSSSFAGPRDYAERGLSDIEIELCKARDSLFDEELYHELTKEARVTLNSGIIITETEIQVPLPNGSTILIDLVDPETTEHTTSSVLPTVILTSLHILLSYAHHLNLKKRQEVPEPLNTKKPQVRPMVFIRPLVAFAIHNTLLEVAENNFTSLLQPFKLAKLPYSIKMSRFSNLENLSTCSTPVQLVEMLLSTSHSTINLLLPCDSSLCLQIHTPYQYSQVTNHWIAPFTLQTSSPTSPDGEISFDTFSDAESPIKLTVEESLSSAASEFLGPTWRKIDLREFENRGKRIRVELRQSNNEGSIVVINGSEEIECISRSLQDVLATISGGN